MKISSLSTISKLLLEALIFIFIVIVLSNEIIQFLITLNLFTDKSTKLIIIVSSLFAMDAAMSNKFLGINPF